jgi:hypothetical protein
VLLPRWDRRLQHCASRPFRDGTSLAVEIGCSLCTITHKFAKSRYSRLCSQLANILCPSSKPHAQEGPCFAWTLHRRASESRGNMNNDLIYASQDRHTVDVVTSIRENLSNPHVILSQCESVSKPGQVPLACYVIYKSVGLVAHWNSTHCSSRVPRWTGQAR